MSKAGRRLLTGAAAALLLALAVGSASATRLSINEPNIRLVWSSLEFRNSMIERVVRCQVTLEGSFHSKTILKIREALIGHLTRANIAACAGGDASVLTETLPWHITYESFAGTLPTITRLSILIVGAGFRIRYGTVEGSNICLARTRVERHAGGWFNVTRPENFLKLRTFTMDPSRTIPLINDPSFGCSFTTLSLEGTAQVYELGTTEQEVLLKLI
jgi:hypothetical protein